MLSSAFIAPELMPGRLGAVAEWNPISATLTATRGLFGNPVRRRRLDHRQRAADNRRVPALVTAATLPWLSGSSSG